MEAARSLGLTYPQAMRYVILPQALRRMLPPLASEFITLLKDSSLLSVIAVAELAYVQSTWISVSRRRGIPPESHSGVVSAVGSSLGGPETR